MRRITPDGQKIAAARKEKRKKQSEVAHDAGISERTLRKIENQNIGIDETILIRIAGLLDKSADELILKSSSHQSAGDTDAFGFMRMRLDRMESGGALIRMAEASDEYEYELKVDPTAETADLMVQLMRTVDYKVGKFQNHKSDGITGPFSDIHRTAKIGEVLSALSGLGILVFANNYRRKKLNDYDANRPRLENVTKMHVCISKSADTEHHVYIDPDDTLPDSPLKRYADLDDDIPF